MARYLLYYCETTPRYSWNIARVGEMHQSVNQSTIVRRILIWLKYYRMKIIRPNKKMCVYSYMWNKSRVGRSAFFFFFFFLYIYIYILSAKPEYDSVISFSKFPVSRHLLKLFLWQVAQFFYILCSQFRQKASGWINKTLLLIKQQKWLSEFCVKIDRVE
jgi:hypothetical protein